MNFDFLTPKGTVTPYPDGIAVRRKEDGAKGILNHCRCSSRFQHYELNLEGYGRFVVEHKQVGELYELMNERAN